MLSVGAAVLVVGPLAGVFVDRWNHRATMLRSEVVRAMLAGALTVVSFLPTRDLPTWLWLVAIYLVVFVLNAAGQFRSPARFAIIADVVDGTAGRARAAGISQATTATATIIGPPLAAPLLFTVGVQWALLANTLSYVVSYLAIRSVRPPGRPAAPRGASTGFRADFVAGPRFFAGNPFLIAILTVAVIAQFGTGALNALDVFGWLASTVLHGFHATLGGLRFGAIDTIFLATGVLIAAAGMYAAIALPPDGQST